MVTLAIWYVSTLNAENLLLSAKMALRAKVSVLYSMTNVKRCYGHNYKTLFVRTQTLKFLKCLWCNKRCKFFSHLFSRKWKMSIIILKNGSVTSVSALRQCISLIWSMSTTITIFLEFMFIRYFLLSLWMSKDNSRPVFQFKSVRKL